MIKKVKIVLKDGAVMPRKATSGSSGYDIYTMSNEVIRPGRNLVKVGVSMELPKGMECQIRPRSGFSVTGFRVTLFDNEGFPYDKMYDADVILGTVDSDYRGEVGVIIKSMEKEEFEIPAGTRIAQAMFCKVPKIRIVEYMSIENNTERGIGGFGHTGSN